MFCIKLLSFLIMSSAIMHSAIDKLLILVRDNFFLAATKLIYCVPGNYSLRPRRCVAWQRIGMQLVKRAFAVQNNVSSAVRSSYCMTFTAAVR